MARSQVKGIKPTANAIRRMTSVARPIHEASRFALQPMLKTAKANLSTYKPNRYEPGPNVVTGKLKKGLSVRLLSKKNGVSQHAVSATGKGIKTAHFVEFGTDPHWQPRRRRMHPGAQPFPFLTPAYHKHDMEAVRRFGQRIGGALENQARRVRAKK
jgi:HK97 gp10 family phage protein